jgi:hypothetical protein
MDVATVKGPVPAQTNRRGMLRRVMGASAAAAALLLVAKGSETAEANSRTTVVGASTDSFGIAAAVGAFDPNTLIGNIGGNGFGVIGTFGSPGYSPPFSAGVLGQGGGAFYGVVGLGQNNPGVYGQSTSSTGVQGISSTGDGILGFSSGNLKYSLAGSGSGQAHGLIGYSENQFGVSGINQTGTNWAGAFFNAQATAPNSGRKGLFVQGDFVVLNGTKNAAVKTQRFGHRKMYAVEATENVFEDFGTATLKGGKARVELDEIFAETVNTGQKYQVYLTPSSADGKGLAVTGKDAHGFTVQEQGAGTGTYEFDYRVVAKVRGHEKTRMEEFVPPQIPPAPVPSGATSRGGEKS